MLWTQDDLEGNDDDNCATLAGNADLVTCDIPMEEFLANDVCRSGGRCADATSIGGRGETVADWETCRETCVNAVSNDGMTCDHFAFNPLTKWCLRYAVDGVCDLDNLKG